MNGFLRLRAAAVACAWAAVLSLGAAEPVGIALQGDTSRPDHSTFVAGEPITLAFTVSNVPAGTADLQLVLDTLDEHERLLEHRVVPVPAPGPDGCARLSVPALAGRLGFFRVKASLSNGVTLPQLGSRRAGYLTYAVVPDPARRRLYPAEETFFGMQGGFGKPPVKPLLGIRWVLGGYSWRDTEPKRAGEFAEARRQGTTKPRVALAGEEAWATYRLPCLYMAPSWAVEAATSSYCTGTLTPEGEKAWADYCAEVGRAFAAEAPEQKERLYQITWEPVYPWGFKGSTEQLLRIYELAWPALHAADPRAKVLGPTGAGISRNDVAWNAGLLRQGLGRWLDGFSIHPYHALPPEREGLIDRVRELRAVLDQLAGKPLELFGTEQGFPTKEDPANDLVQAQGLLRQNLVMMGEGYRLNFAFYIVDYPTEPGYGYYYNLTPKIAWGPDCMSPKPAAAAYAAQSFLLEGHRSAGAIEWLGATAWGYAFERPGSIVLALWDYGDQPRDVSLPVGRDWVQVCDWMGNAQDVRAPGGTLALRLTPDPVYVTGVAPELWSASADRPLRVESARLVSFAGARVNARSTVSASVGRAVHGRLVLTLPPAFATEPLSRPVTVPAGASRRVTLTVPVPASAALGSYPAALVLEDAAGTPVAAAGLMLVVAEPVSVQAVVPAEAKGGCAVSVRLREEQGTAFRGEVAVDLDGVPFGRASASVRLKPGETRDVRLELPDAEPVPGRGVSARVAVTSQAGARHERALAIGFADAVRCRTAPPVDGRVDDWPNATPVRLGDRSWLVRSPEFHAGSADARADLWLAWDQAALYLACAVRDDVFLQPHSGFMTWKGDCLQVGLDLDPDRRGESTGNLLAEKGRPRRVSELDLALTSAGPQVYRTISFDPERLPVGLLGAEAVRLVVTRAGTRSTYEAAIPWTVLGADGPPAPGSTIGFALTVNDLDSAAQADPSALGVFGGVAGKKDPDRFGRVVLASAESTPAAGTASLRPAGAMGQSQPATEEPLGFLASVGATIDTKGLLWTVAGETAYGFAPGRQGSPILVRTIVLPAAVTSRGVCWDHHRLFAVCGDGRIHTLDPVGGTVAPFCPWPERAKAFGVAPDGLTRGFAGKAKLFILEGNTVRGAGHTGQDVGVVLDLPVPADTSWWYCAVGIEPDSGDLLVGSYWPDSRVYRFGVDGEAVTGDGWPRNGHAQLLTEIGGQAWILAAGGSAAPLPTVRRGPADDLPGLPAAWTWYHSGLTAGPDGGWWLASSQGLVRYDPHRRAEGVRLGGLPGVSLLGMAPDGTVIGMVEDGQRCVRLGLGDEPDAALRSDANEPWRTGNGWSGRAAGLAWDGERFLVLDRAARCLWRFDPWHTAWGEKPWVALTEPNTFAAPRLLAAGDGFFWLVDGDRLLEGTHSAPAACREVALPDGVSAAGAVGLSATDDERLYVAWADQVVALDRSAEATWHVAWRQGAGVRAVRGLAALADDSVAVALADGLVLLAAATGQPLSSIAAADAPRGMDPVAVTAYDRWILVADRLNARLLRFCVTR